MQQTFQASAVARCASEKGRAENAVMSELAQAAAKAVLEGKKLLRSHCISTVYDECTLRAHGSKVRHLSCVTGNFSTNSSSPSFYQGEAITSAGALSLVQRIFHTVPSEHYCHNRTGCQQIFAVLCRQPVRSRQLDCFRDASHSYRRADADHMAGTQRWNRSADGRGKGKGATEFSLHQYHMCVSRLCSCFGGRRQQDA